MNETDALNKQAWDLIADMSKNEHPACAALRMQALMLLSLYARLVHQQRP